MIRRGRAGAAIATVALFVGAVMAPALMTRPPHEWLAALALCLLAGWIAIEDLRTMLIPDLAVLALGAVGLALAIHDLADPGAVFLWAASALAFAALLFVFSWLYGRLRGASVMGFGDIKLVAASGLLIGPWGVGMQILIASVSAILFVGIRAIRRWRRPRFAARIPFGTFLAPAAAIVWAWFGRGI